jgi:hypothetical protein
VQLPPSGVLVDGPGYRWSAATPERVDLAGAALPEAEPDIGHGGGQRRA